MTTTPTLRLERRILAGWTIALAVLVASTIRAVPPVLAWTLLPYLALVARHLLAPRDRVQDRSTTATPEPESAPIQAVPEPEPVAPELPNEPEPSEAPARPAPARPRRRPRAKPTPLAEPAPAAWVQVGPGRFVRGEPPEPPAPPEEHAPKGEPAESAEAADRGREGLDRADSSAPEGIDPIPATDADASRDPA